MEKKNIYQKLLTAQMEIGAIKKDSQNPFFKSKYFDINAILAEVKPILNKNGLVLLQAIVMVDGHSTLNTAIVDADSKEKIESNFYLPEITDPQKVGAGITYYRRFSLQSLLALEAEDDDGNTASASASVKKSLSKPEKEFMKSMEPTDEDIISWKEIMEEAKDLKSLQSIWKTVPPIIQEKLDSFKNELKFKLS